MARILLVDDEPSIRLFYSSVLADQGHEVLEAKSSREAMEVLRSKPVDLAVLDIKLGFESGLDLLQQIVSADQDLPVMILTAYTSFQDDYTSWLADRYIIKSSDPGEFLQAVERILQRVEVYGAPQQLYRASFQAGASPS